MKQVEASREKEGAGATARPQALDGEEGGGGGGLEGEGGGRRNGQAPGTGR